MKNSVPKLHKRVDNLAAELNGRTKTLAEAFAEVTDALTGMEARIDLLTRVVNTLRPTTPATPRTPTGEEIIAEMERSGDDWTTSKERLMEARYEQDAG